MNPKVRKLVSMSVLVLAAASFASARERGDEGRRSPLEIERGWIEQQQKFDARLAARGEGFSVPGAVILSPFPEASARSDAAEAPGASGGATSPQSQPQAPRPGDLR